MMAKEEATVEELVNSIKQGKIRLPEMQRGYVWPATRVRDLLDSLYRDYPSGTILLWETDSDVPQQEFAIKQQDSSSLNHRLLLDGQQRLTSLSAVIRGEPVYVRGRKRPIEILFNLNHPDDLSVVTEVDENNREVDGLIEDETDSNTDELQARIEKMAFVISTKQLANLPHWVKVSDVFKTDSNLGFLKKAGSSNLDDPQAEKFFKRLDKLRSIKKYFYRLDVLEKSLSYDEVTEIFVRVNSLGVKLRGSDLAMAQISSKWHGSLETFQGFQKECEQDGFKLDLGIFLRNLVAFATGYSRFETVGRLSQPQLEEAWKQSVKGMQYALNFLKNKNNVGIESPALLSSPYLIIALAYFGYKCDYMPGSEDEGLARWALLTNAKGRYSRGSSVTILDQDLAILRDGGGVGKLLDQLRQQVGRLAIEPGELEGRNQNSALFKTMFLAFRDGGAKDWDSKIGIALDNSGKQHRLEIHHLFPKGVLKDGTYTTREVNDIANLAFIGGRTNRKIGSTPPEDYFPDFITKLGEEPFEVQCIPIDRYLLELDNYREFLARRRELISERLNSFLGNT
ncbi:MAG: DUF262 domain-containing protein [Rhodobacteraceae bacterium]|nr:DUF262 domain-containing protein [Paracoccaceae bacterium]MDE2739135.1 DUF262 domain-containing protein [Paracoccaceae bacterium]